MIRRIERDRDTYIAHGDDGIVWKVELGLDLSGTPFREEMVWAAASVIAIGGGPCVHFLAADSGAIVKRLQLQNYYFGHFGFEDGTTLYVLGWRHVLSIDATLVVRWIAKDVAVDGITWVGQDGEQITVSAEMDPPGGWERVVLDATTGRILERGRE